MDKLKLHPCPFCGSPAKTDYEDRLSNGMVEVATCSNTDCNMYETWMSIEEWNTRHPKEVCPTCGQRLDVHHDRIDRCHCIPTIQDSLKDIADLKDRVTTLEVLNEKRREMLERCITSGLVSGPYGDGILHLTKDFFDEFCELANKD